jgi:hypothetical protein
MNREDARRALIEALKAGHEFYDDGSEAYFARAECDPRSLTVELAHYHIA